MIFLIYQATFYCHKTVIQSLLKAGADPTIVGHNGCSALDLATLVDDNNTELIRKMIFDFLVYPEELNFIPLIFLLLYTIKLSKCVINLL